MATPADRKAGRPPSGARLAILFLFLTVLVLAAGATFTALHLWTRTASPDAPLVEVTIPRGATLRDTADTLHKARLVEQPTLFRALARTLGREGAVRYGTYAIPEGAGWGAILRQLQEGRVLRVRIAIPEGLPSVLVAERLNATPRLTGHVEPPAEGTILPATYEADIGEDRAAVLARMEEEMAKTLATLWEDRDDDLPVQTPAEAVILASIVEKESGVASERRRVAGLYANRLRLGMRLQADPTVIYPVTKGRPLGRRILRSELLADNGYNTYARAGLPVGPITNPGRESLAAVLHPERHDYLYMVADGSGGHRFSASYGEHQRRVGEWRAYRQREGV